MKLTRKALLTYAGLLGRGSVAAQALEFYDNLTAGGTFATIKRETTGFSVTDARGDVRRFV